ncbi:2'-5' RNA ligase [Rhodothalassium salexigens]|uniref:RNA 2',3'-cyclic phosphodiesterase n=1 Tax=Rhodothalassium salexigens TaxID=1086 RepID=UPI00191307E5|nr:RNA 2',3'-cyclic phosphodiesterase [Rhodothalassium salexigens]MBK5911080.1 2'-5' RNA ligase [Rhodothalassium salexigens]MBK5920027.1 2'-5' RNA ligase [Rhodothalassium salexigens]
MHRLFVGLALPQPVRQQLLLLMGGVDGARWQGDHQLHLTLRFIGEVPARQADDIRSALAQVRAAPFTVTLEGLGTFGKPRSPRSLWIGVADADPLKHLHEKIDQALVRVGLAPEQRKFKPHVTLARFKRTNPAKLDGYLEARAGARTAAFPVTRFTLFESHLCSDGALYDPVETYPLDRSGTEAVEDGPDLPGIAAAERLHVE